MGRDSHRQQLHSQNFASPIASERPGRQRLHRSCYRIERQRIAAEAWAVARHSRQKSSRCRKRHWRRNVRVGPSRRTAWSLTTSSALPARPFRTRTWRHREGRDGWRTGRTAGYAQLDPDVARAGNQRLPSCALLGRAVPPEPRLYRQRPWTELSLRGGCRRAPESRTAIGDRPVIDSAAIKRGTMVSSPMKP